MQSLAEIESICYDNVLRDAEDYCNRLYGDEDYDDESDEEAIRLRPYETLDEHIERLGELAARVRANMSKYKFPWYVAECKQYLGLIDEAIAADQAEIDEDERELS